MTSAPMTSDLELVDMLDEVWTSMETIGAGLTEEQWKTGTECPGWTVQDNLVHITALEAMSIGKNLPVAELPDDLPHVKNDFGRTNEQWIESRRSWSGADALAEFHAVTRERIAGLRALDDAGFGADSWTPQGPGTVRTLLPFRIFDSWVHEQDMRGAVDRPGDLDSAAARFSTEMMLEVLPYVIGKKVGAPDGSTVVLALTGPIATTTAVGVTDGRARALDTVPEMPTVTVSLASDAYARLACGRRDPDEALVTGVVAIEGDVELGGALVRQLNYMF